MAREKIVLFTGALFIGLFSLYFLLAKPLYIKHLETKKIIEKKDLLLRRYKAVIARKDQIKNRVAYIKKEFNELNNLLLTGAKPSLAASELQIILENIAKRKNVTIKNVTNKKPHEKDIFYQIPIEITIESTLRQLKDVIYHVENSSKFLLIRDLYIRLKKAGNPEILESKLTVDGFIKAIPEPAKGRN